MISRDQIRAARALLDWSQPQLAERAGVSTDLISKIENGVTDGSLKTLNKIQDVLSNAGVEFLDNDGIRRESKGVKEYRGGSEFVEFMTDVYNNVDDGGQVFVSNVDEKHFVKWLGGKTELHIQKMLDIKNLDFRILVCEGDDFRPATYAKYKTLPEQHFGDIPLYIYGNKTALIVFEPNDVNVYVINHPDVTSFFKFQFLKRWGDE
jgi:DNA-binding XRE family transcriptional regulator